METKTFEQLIKDLNALHGHKARNYAKVGRAIYQIKKKQSLIRKRIRRNKYKNQYQW